MSARTLFHLCLAVTLIFRLGFSALMPMTGDEAYFIDWGRWPDWGFYDHPPMIGWWLAALLQAGDAAWWLRLPATLLPAALALLVRRAAPALWPDMQGERADWAALLVLLAPVNVWNVFITTDTPLVLFCVAASLAWLHAARASRPWRAYALCGLMLAGAVLSKYFAALLGFAFLVDALLALRSDAPSGRKKLAGLTIAYACVLPALLLMAWWNAGHCWPNYMFNFVNRHAGAGLSWTTPLLYAATLLYALTPPALWLAFRMFRTHGTHNAMEHTDATLARLAWVPLALFAALSLVKQIGLHWILAFVPLALLPLARTLALTRLRRLGAFFAGFALLHLVAIAALSRLPLETWRNHPIYDGLVLTFDSAALLDELQPYAQDYVFATDGYSNAATLSYNARRHFSVFGPASSHARHDDILTDYRALDGRNILVLMKTAPDAAWYGRYFAHVDIRPFSVRGVTFWRVLGQGFRYTAYRDEVLAAIRAKYYALPRWLPQTGCYFDRYF